MFLLCNCFENPHLKPLFLRVFFFFLCISTCTVVLDIESHYFVSIWIYQLSNPVLHKSSYSSSFSSDVELISVVEWPSGVLRVDDRSYWNTEMWRVVKVKRKELMWMKVRLIYRLFSWLNIEKTLFTGKH